MLGGRLAPGLLRLAARRPAVPRCAAATARSLHASRPPCAETVKITLIEEGEEVEVDAEIGKSLLEVAHANEIDLEGACDGSLACSTCHLILTQEVFDSLDPPEEEEEDMLDLAFDLTDTSRLGCQIIVTKELDGMVARIPDGSNDMRPP
jgi:ferredoxin